ncbi:uncharacterized protein LOC107968686 [Pan troglodytes]|uniref:uncharacterized protein LOC107968686 n=1 Tax=Pan troglodytes TaxID=9598 RepID=UPI0007DBB449
MILSFVSRGRWRDIAGDWSFPSCFWCVLSRLRHDGWLLQHTGLRQHPAPAAWAAPVTAGAHSLQSVSSAAASVNRNQRHLAAFSATLFRSGSKPRDQETSCLSAGTQARRHSRAASRLAQPARFFCSPGRGHGLLPGRSLPAVPHDSWQHRQPLLGSSEDALAPRQVQRTHPTLVQEPLQQIDRESSGPDVALALRRMLSRTAGGSASR